MVRNEASRLGPGGGHGLPVAGCTVCMSVCVCVCVCVTIVLWFSEMSRKIERGCSPGGNSAMSQEETGEWKTSFFTSQFLTKKI